MESIRRRIVTLFATRVNASRALRFTNADRLPVRILFDISESAEKVRHNKHEALLEITVEALIDSSNGDEGLLLDNELRDIQTLVFSPDNAYDELVGRTSYTGCSYAYSEDGNNIVGLTATFEVKYNFLTKDPTAQE